MAKQRASYVCGDCGYKAAKWIGRCASCGAWGSMAAEQASTQLSSGVRTRAATPPSVTAARLRDVPASTVTRRQTGIAEFDRVLGGGVVPGAAILLSGEPGVGKSTLLLRAAASVAETGASVLYVSGEESAGQIRLRAERTGCLAENLFCAAETDLSVALGYIESADPDFIIVDSVQTLASPDVEGIAGGPAQVREVASVLVRVAKNRGTPIIIVGHVTKDGAVAGPRTLEHLVDVVCHFEGDKQTALRFLRTLKNRFGATDEIGCFEMRETGIVEVTDPSELFISGTNAEVSGTCVALAIEGRRAIPVEVQALVAPSSGPNPRRVTSGVDPARLAMILAILEKRVGIKLHTLDVYVSTVGGVKLLDPGADLAIALAIVSAAYDSPLPPTVAAAGELSLAGEIRAVIAKQQRKKEAERLGYKHFIDHTASTLQAACQRIAKLKTAGQPGEE